MVIPALGKGPTAIVTDPAQCAAIRINDGLQMWLGNWQLDVSQGLPWQQIRGQKRQSLVAIGNLLRKAILDLGAPTIIKVTQLSIVFATSLRDLGYSFTALADTGAKVVGGSNGPNGVPFVEVQ